MKFIESFTAARKVGTPLVKIATPDPASTIQTIRQSLDDQHKKNSKRKSQEQTPLVSWDGVHGLRGVNETGTKEVASMLQGTQLDIAATVQLGIALSVAENAKEDVIIFAHNPDMFWVNDPIPVQGVWNLRDSFKANGNMLVLMVPVGGELPPQLVNDVLSLEDPLPTRAEIVQIVKDTFTYAKVATPKKVDLDAAADALIGIAAFPSEQATAMCLDKETGVLDVATMWERKRSIVSAVPGLSFYTGAETLADLGGLTNLSEYGRRIMNGKRGANLILRLDEIEKAFAGNGTDTSGVKTELLGNFLTWVEDKKVICILLLGVPGSGKSFFIYCLGGEFGKPVINFDVSGMQDSLVGNSGKNLRRAEQTVEAISDGQIVLIATANSLRGLPPELLSRFEKGGIFFVDTPNDEERAATLKLKIKKYGLTSKQVADMPNMDHWTGREIDAVCDKAYNLDLTCAEAAKYVVPLTVSQAETIDMLRQSAHGRYISASSDGVYQYKKDVKEVVHMPTTTYSPGRKFQN